MSQQVQELLDRITQLERERDRAGAVIGKTRMCLNCGRYIDASLPRETVLPECVGPEGLSGCTFDMTPQEAWLHWRTKADELERERYTADDPMKAYRERVAVWNAAIELAAESVANDKGLHYEIYDWADDESEIACRKKDKEELAEVVRALKRP